MIDYNQIDNILIEANTKLSAIRHVEPIKNTGFNIQFFGIGQAFGNGRRREWNLDGAHRTAFITCRPGDGKEYAVAIGVFKAKQLTKEIDSASVLLFIHEKGTRNCDAWPLSGLAVMRTKGDTVFEVNSSIVDASHNNIYDTYSGIREMVIKAVSLAANTEKAGDSQYFSILKYALINKVKHNIRSDVVTKAN
ncbi:hypothetical protein [Proteus mirabilis]|uniref:hypothetical protein n=1 Tax=Proteus mirabilis TaxID=584 RepID=UPI0034D6A52E